MSGHLSEFDTPNIHASEAVLIIHSKAHINVPAQDVFRCLRNVETWKDWNRFVPKVNITHQPPEDDHATAAEISEIVRNTSIIGSFDSDLTDGGDGLRPHSPDEQPPPRFRLNSISSQMSRASTDSRRPRSEGVDANGLNANSTTLRAGSMSSVGSTKSAAQRFQETQEARRASVASGHEPSPLAKSIDNTTNHRASIAAAPESLSRSGSKKGSKPKYTNTAAAQKAAADKAYQSLMAIYGEPSVRLMIGTKMTLFSRMKDSSPPEFTQTNMVVTDVSRPDDPVTEPGTTALTRSKTHNLERAGFYRIVWTTDSEGASIFHLGSIFSGSKLPKYFLQAERVHEIQPTVDGAGNETCMYRTWECMKGPGAKAVKKKYEAHLQKMFVLWSEGLKDFCEGLHAPNVDRRDFSISRDEPIVFQTLS